MTFLKNFFYQRSGNKNGQPLVFLHGLMGYSQNWRRIALAFEDSHEVFVYDQRGHGKSFKPDLGYSPEDYAQDLKQILDELGWEQIDLVGHSMGGRNALHFANKYPSRVRKLVIEDIGPNADMSAIDRILGMINSVPVPFKTKNEARIFFANEFEAKVKNYTKQPKAMGQYFYSNLEEKPDGLTDWRFNKRAIDLSLEEGRAIERWHEIENLICPTLLVRGENSPDLPREVFEKMLALNPSIQGVEIKNAGHWVHFDQPQEFITQLKLFLR